MLDIHLSNEGSVTGTAARGFPEMPPVLGYAATGEITAYMPPIRGRRCHPHLEWRRYLTRMHTPRIVAMQDVDHSSGRGALFGKVRARISRALGCVAYVTNEAVQDLSANKKLGFQLFSGSVAVSHAQAHVVDFGEPVEMGGLRISCGDLLHGDLHGIHSIPAGYDSQLIRSARGLFHKEPELPRLCGPKGLSVDKLAAALEETAGVLSCH